MNKITQLIDLTLIELGSYQDGLTSIAIVLGGIWAVYHFCRQRLRYPRAKLEHRVTHWPINEINKRLFRVSLFIENQSEVLMRLDSGFCRLQQVDPCNTDDLTNPKLRDQMEMHGETELPWRTIVKVKLDWHSSPESVPALQPTLFSRHGGREIEPGESDELHFDFLIEPYVSRVLVYTYLHNKSKRTRKGGIGWNLTTIHIIKENEPYE